MVPKQTKIEFPEAKTLTQMVFEIMREGGWYMPYELCRFIQARHGMMASDASITARLRDLRKSAYGAHVIEKRIREGSRAYEYRLASA